VAAAVTLLAEMADGADGSMRKGCADKEKARAGSPVQAFLNLSRER
jgi:hypothetical protein